MKTYKVTVQGTVVRTLTVQASDEDTAHSEAHECFDIARALEGDAYEEEILDCEEVEAESDAQATLSRLRTTALAIAAQSRDTRERTRATIDKFVDDYSLALRDTNLRLTREDAANGLTNAVATLVVTKNHARCFSVRVDADGTWWSAEHNAVVSEEWARKTLEHYILTRLAGEYEKALDEQPL